METYLVSKTRRFKTIVPNPLGWDGDSKLFPSGLLKPLVSNPLGWDGDLV